MKWTTIGLLRSLHAVQKMLQVGDAINRIEVNVDNRISAPEYAKAIEEAVGPKYTTTTWQEQNQQLMSALNMERIVTFITIGLIEIVAALNIFIMLVMMVMEKYRDIAVLMSMGARHSQIRRIFMMQGVLIGIVGSVLGLIVGYTLCYFANRYQWVKLPEAVYALPFVPFEPRWVDGIWIAGAGGGSQLSGDALSRAKRHPDRPRRSPAIRIGDFPYSIGLRRIQEYYCK